MPVRATSGEAMADPALEAVAGAVLAEIRDGDRLGLGTGRAASAFIARLGERVQQGLRVSGVPTSEASARLARDAGIELIELDEGAPLELTVDGADEVAPNLDLVKGWGGALVRERIVAVASARELILVGPEKLVPVLGSRRRLPVEVVPFALPLAARLLAPIAGTPTLRRAGGGRPFVTDNGNVILDCAVGPIADPERLEREIHTVPGVVGTGLFVGIAHTVLVGEPGGVRELRRPDAR